jgi:hypothetical protein
VLAEHEGREEAEDKLGPLVDASAAAQKALKTNLELLIAEQAKVRRCRLTRRNPS